MREELNNYIKSLIYILLFSTLSLSGYAEVLDSSKVKDFIQLRGYVKDMQTFSFGNSLDYTISDNLIHNRLNFRIYPAKNLTLGLELRNRLFWGESVKITPNYGNQFDKDPGLADFSWVLLDHSNMSLITQMDRLWLNWNNELWEVRVGRQRINWGITGFWNSNDLFNAYSFVDFDYEERPGVDAIKLHRFLDGMSGIEVAVKPGKDSSDWVGAMRYHWNKWTYDFQLLGGVYYTDIAIGTGWAGNLWRSSFKGELTYFHPYDNPGDTAGSLSLSTSLDYIFSNGVYASAGYLLNSSGITGAPSISDITLLNTGVTTKSLMPAKHSILANASYPITPLWNATIVGVYSPGMNLFLGMPSVGYSMSNSSELALFAQSYWFGDPLKNIGNAVYIRFKMSF